MKGPLKGKLCRVRGELEGFRAVRGVIFQACIAIGLAVFMAHCVLIPIDGCSINPTRSFGPALLNIHRMEAPKSEEPGANMVGAVAVASTVKVEPTVSDDVMGPSYWRDMWIFWIGPLLGASLAAGVYKIMLKLDEPAKETPDPEAGGYGYLPRLLGGKAQQDAGSAKSSEVPQTEGSSL